MHNQSVARQAGERGVEGGHAEADQPVERTPGFLATRIQTYFALQRATGLLRVCSAYGIMTNMVTPNEIRTFCQRLAVEYRPSRIVLFGSYARGRPRPDSDVDLLVVMPFKGNGVSKAAEMILKLRPSFAVELVIRTPTDVARRLAMNDFFLKEATRGRLLYEAPDA